MPYRLNYTSKNHYINVKGGGDKLLERDACVKEFRTNFSHVKLEETEIPIEGGEVIVDDTRKVILITPNQNVHSFGSRYLDYPMKNGSLQNISKKDIHER